MTTALITGAAGQDGYYLTELLLERGYDVHAVVRKASVPSTRLDEHVRNFGARLTVHSGDVLDSGFLRRVLDRAGPDEVYNLAAMSDVAASFEIPDYTLQVNVLGPARLLDAIMGAQAFGRRSIRFYQASTSELYGDSSVAQDEKAPMHPMSPYAAGKLAAFWLTRIYRDGHGVHASNGILFNHESPLRADCFVSKKVAQYVARWFSAGGGIKPLQLGNLEAHRDWSHARDMVRGMHAIVLHDTPGDYVLASGRSRSVRGLVTQAFAVVGKTIEWSEGKFGRIDGELVVIGECSELKRPLDVPRLMGDAFKAMSTLGWRPLISFDQMLQEMVEAELAKLD